MTLPEIPATQQTAGAIPPPRTGADYGVPMPAAPAQEQFAPSAGPIGAVATGITILLFFVTLGIWGSSTTSRCSTRSSGTPAAGWTACSPAHRGVLRPGPAVPAEQRGGRPVRADRPTAPVKRADRAVASSRACSSWSARSSGSSGPTGRSTTTGANSAPRGPGAPDPAPLLEGPGDGIAARGDPGQCRERGQRPDRLDGRRRCPGWCAASRTRRAAGAMRKHDGRTRAHGLAVDARRTGPSASTRNSWPTTAATARAGVRARLLGGSMTVMPSCPCVDRGPGAGAGGAGRAGTGCCPRGSPPRRAASGRPASPSAGVLGPPRPRRARRATVSSRVRILAPR